MPPKSKRRRQSQEAGKLGREAQKRMRNEAVIQDGNEATPSSAVPVTSSPPAVAEGTETVPVVSSAIVSETPASSECVGAS